MVMDMDPAFLRVGGFALYWYGAVYTFGFLGTLVWLLARRARLGLSRRDVFGLTVLVEIGVLVGGRIFDILVYEADWYRAHPLAAFDWWQGGMASHGVLLGSLVAMAAFAYGRGRPVLVLLDEAVVPAAFLLAVGRVGNFIEGGVIGSLSDLPWAVVMPGVEGARHPVALYDGLKNLALVPVLWLALHRWPAGRGVSLGLFMMLYAGLRTLVDFFRDYESTMWGLPPGQVFNLAMAGAGLAVLVWVRLRPLPAWRPDRPAEARAGALRVVLFCVLALYPLGIPTSWTRANIEEMRSRPTPAETPAPGG